MRDNELGALEKMRLEKQIERLEVSLSVKQDINEKQQRKIDQLEQENEEFKTILGALKRRFIIKPNGEIVVGTIGSMLEDMEDIREDMKVIKEWLKND